MKKFTLYKYPKLYFYGALFTDLLIMIACLVLIIGILLPAGLGLPWILMLILLISVICIGLGIALLLERKLLFMEFGVTSEGIEVYHPSKGTIVFFWSDIKESGIYRIREFFNQRSGNFVLSEFFENHEYICFSKRPLTKKDKRHISECAKTDILCIAYREEVLLAVREYYPISLTPIDINLGWDSRYD
ncbi:MAG: hypothetical protein IJX07_04525 [Bacillales bacterium]|nr:hypothetical protein [Bacillales bacterium]